MVPSAEARRLNMEPTQGVDHVYPDHGISCRAVSLLGVASEDIFECWQPPYQSAEDILQTDTLVMGFYSLKTYAVEDRCVWEVAW